MKKRSISIRIVVLATVLFLSGCGIFSLHPLYHKKDLLVKTELIGTWQNEKDEDILVIIDTLEDKKYKFVIIDGEDTLKFEMGLVELNNQYFIDLFPYEDCDFYNNGNCVSELLLANLTRNYIPAHTFMKIDILSNGMAITEFDNDRLIKLFDQNRIRLAHEQPGEDDDYVVITASTNDLQKFIARYANDKEAFNETEKYHRL